MLSLLILTCIQTTIVADKKDPIMGAGATFPLPLYTKLFNEYYKQTNIKINYQGIGSGGGIRQLNAKTVNFGATDAFIKDTELENFDAPIVHIPTAAGAVALSYNIPGIPTLNLTADIIAKLFSGNITKWNDTEILNINPNVNIPKMGVVTIQRSDASGTTLIFTDYLTKASSIWAEKKLLGKMIKWPKGLAGKGNAGVAGLIKQIPGSIGYIGSVYAIQNKMTMATIQNSSGNFIKPTVSSITEATNTEIPDDTRINIGNTSSENGYPISGLTWLIVYQNQNYNNKTKEDYKELINLLNWIVKEGQSYAEPLNFSPLSKSLLKKATAIIDSIEY